MKKFINPPRNNWKKLIARPIISYQEIKSILNEVFQTVKNNGDMALKKYTKKFDRVSLENLSVKHKEITNSKNLISNKLKKAINIAKLNIEVFHKAQKSKPINVTTTIGVNCWQEKRPIEKVGLYIPGGTAPLFSTILMLAIPAKIAGCKEIVLCTPPNREGEIPPVVLYTANLCGITKIYKVGGIQAIAALTFGTETIPKVYKIFGPGNQYVTAAKQFATYHNVAIDMPAGPSELLIAADDSAIPSYIASDLLSQAEHGPDSQVILVTTSLDLMDFVKDEIKKQINPLPRKEIMKQAIANSKMIYFDSNQNAMEFINAYAPEHYIICMKNEEYYIREIKNAGSVFIGNYSPESAGDYASGTNHVLPTNGYAKQYSGVNIDSFLKQMSFQKISVEGIKNIGPAIEAMASAEGLDAHKNAVSLRLNDLKNE